MVLNAIEVTRLNKDVTSVEVYPVNTDYAFPFITGISDKIPSDVLAWKRLRQWMNIDETEFSNTGRSLIIVEATIGDLEQVVALAWESEPDVRKVNKVRRLLGSGVTR